MQVRLLGPVEVIADDDRRVPLGPPQRRAVFAALAIDAGHLVSLDTLTGRVWDEPPQRAADSVYAHITRLRQALAGIEVPVERRSGGYVLRVDRDLVDVHRIHDLARRAQRPGRDDSGRVAVLEEAIGLWRGSPLTGVPGDWAARIRHGIEQQYVGAVVSWAKAQIRLGRPAPVVTELAEVVLQFPLAEPLADMLMRALCALGRTAEALAHYARLRGYLVEHLGIEPGAELRALHQEMLRGDQGFYRGSELAPLTTTESLTLLRRLVGDRVDTDPAGAAMLVERCARLPLALRIAGELAVARPAVGFAELVDELAVAAGASAGFNGAGFSGPGKHWPPADRTPRSSRRRSPMPPRNRLISEAS
jgi:DNA-binding SARP family transcriptional activator